MFRFRSRAVWMLGLLAATVLAVSCAGGGGGGGGNDPVDVDPQPITPTSADYIVLAWNDLGMHCLNPTYDQAVILPPYNTVWAQVIKRGDPPQIVTTGITVQYSIVNNTFSYGKRSYGQFWDNLPALFGVALAHDTGLNLEDPNIHNGLSGSMVQKSDHFQVNGIPLVPVNDSLVWNPFQVANIVVRDSSNTIIAQTQSMVPTSDEINCATCHAQGADGTIHLPGGGGTDVLANILAVHDALQGTALAASPPKLCAGCHGSPALGQMLPGSSGKFLTESVHGFHAAKGAACYDCHPGATTKCSRSLAHMGTTGDGNCTTCHGDMSQVANSVSTGARVPWVSEPKCVTCHAGVAEVDTGTTLYRNARGHGGVSCPACHQSPHAMIPSREAADNYQAVQYQTKPQSIGDCKVCHDNSRGEGFNDFASAHGGTRATACNVCHTKPPQMVQSQWPHQFQWKAR
jgi:hypothetical protein